MTKKLVKIGISLALAGLLAVPAMAAGGMGRGNNCNMQNKGQCAGMIRSLPQGELSDEETALLTHMREEEKLARDVYLTLYDQWAHPTFANIARSEQQHMDTMKLLVDKYNLTDPVADDARGKFTDTNLGELYEDLIAQGQLSLVDALKVGATIEDLDIYDLQNALAVSDDADVNTAYQNLMKGSRNHLRAFVSQLGVNGGSYAPQYLTDETFEAIISSSWERGFYNEKGEAIGGTGCGKKGRRGRGQKQGGECIAPGASTSIEGLDSENLLSRNGKGGGRGGQGPGDGSGNGGNGPKDGSGNGKKSGDCVNS